MNVNKLSILSFLLFIFVFLNIAQAKNTPNFIKENLVNNTFMIIPINQYATPITKDVAQDYFARNCHLETLQINNKLNCQKLENCEGDNCIIEYSEHGTAFIIEDAGELHLKTAWHVVFPSHAAGLIFAKNYLETSSNEVINSIYSNFKPEFLLVNNDEKIIYDTRLDKPTFYNKFGNPLSTLYAQQGINPQGPFGFMENIPEDYVEIKLSRKISNGLKVAPSNNVDKNQNYFTAGFGFDRYEMEFKFLVGQQFPLIDLLKSADIFMDFQLNPLPISIESFKSLTEEQQLVIIGYSKESSQKQVFELGRSKVRAAIDTVLAVQMRIQKDFIMEKHAKVLFTNITSLPGSSGSPLLNQQGLVVGILTNAIFKLDTENKKIKSFGSGIHLF